MVDGGLVVVSEDGGRAARRFLVRSLILLLAFSVGVVGLQVPPAVADEDELPPVGTVVRMSASGQWTEDAYDYGLVKKGSFVESIEATLVAREEAWDGSRVKDTWQGTVSGEQYAEVSHPAVYEEGGDIFYAACSSYDRVGYSSKVRWEDGGQSGLPSLNVSIGADGVWTLNMSPVVVGPSATVESAPDCELSPSGPVLTASTFSVINLLEDPIRLEDTDPDPARFAAEATVPARGTTIGGGYVDYSLRASIDAPVDSGSCKKVKKKKVAYKTITPLGGRFVPDVHWYTTKITVGQCRKNGKTYITGLKVKRKVEKGFLPRAIGLVGWSSRADNPTRYSPPKIPRSGWKYASARFQYTACFNLTKLLDKGGLKKHVKEPMQRGLKVAIRGVLKKSGITRINKVARKSVAKKWKRQVDHAFKKGTIKTYLNQKYRIPKKIGRFIEEKVSKQKSKVKYLLKGRVIQALENGNYDDLTADGASRAMIYLGFKKLDRLVNFCGGPLGDYLNTWDVSIELSGGGKKVTVRRNTHYRHPLMRVRRA